MILRWATVALLLGAAATENFAVTNTAAEAENEGRELARQLCELQPVESFTNASSLIIQPARGKGGRREIPLRTVNTVTATNWIIVYESLPNTNAPDCERLSVIHTGAEPNEYSLTYLQTNGGVEVAFGTNGVKIARQGSLDVCRAFLSFDAQRQPVGTLTMHPFAHSDFWLADLGLEFLHWPAQKVLKKELKKGQSCAVLESCIAELATNGYSRVVSWIDIDTGGIVQAEAYDAKGKLLKEFEVKELEKINGRMEVSEIQMRNVQTGSRTLLRFKFEKRK